MARQDAALKILENIANLFANLSSINHFDKVNNIIFYFVSLFKKIANFVFSD